MDTATPLAIIIDLDNTLIDSAQRKYSILTNLMRVDITLEDIRDDFSLTKILGKLDSKSSREFFKILTSENGILNHEAPLFDGALQTIKSFLKSGFKILFVTARSETSRNATTQELKRLGLNPEQYELYMASYKDPKYSLDEIKNFKSVIFQKLSNQFTILAVISDRPEDIEAAYSNKIPSVIFRSTLNEEDAEQLSARNTAGAKICTNWIEVIPAIEQLNKRIIRQWNNS